MSSFIKICLICIIGINRLKEKFHMSGKNTLEPCLRKNTLKPCIRKKHLRCLGEKTP